MTVNTDAGITIVAETNENTSTNAKKQLLQTKSILNIEMSAKGGPVFTFSLPEAQLVPLIPHQLRHC